MSRLDGAALQERRSGPLEQPWVCWMPLPAASRRKVELALPLLKRRHQKKGPRRWARSNAAPTWVWSLPRITERAAIAIVVLVVEHGLLHQGLGLVGVAADEVAGDDIHRGELHAAVGGVHLGDVGLRGLALHRVVAAAHLVVVDALGDVLQRHAPQAGAVA
ncbi:hypothetical protein PR202_ga03506 [Eleusine coracana subsp. coracana]|uniref:Uncharacterized protein n=1 Tax=Eleusine coracana subsp. coracana TaxID=191504 RepID=A0AAV5BM65_ELECO|nr:hypothetical protein PR202_ga03506 [Eleusine coracana subsp. coracana]